MMGKYGWFVGWAYAIVLGGLAGFLWHSIKQSRRVKMKRVQTKQVDQIY